MQVRSTDCAICVPLGTSPFRNTRIGHSSRIIGRFVGTIGSPAACTPALHFSAVASAAVPVIPAQKGVTPEKPLEAHPRHRLAVGRDIHPSPSPRPPGAARAPTFRSGKQSSGVFVHDHDATIHDLVLVTLEVTMPRNQARWRIELLRPPRGAFQIGSSGACATSPAHTGARPDRLAARRASASGDRPCSPALHRGSPRSSSACVDTPRRHVIGPRLARPGNNQRHHTLIDQHRIRLIHQRRAAGPGSSGPPAPSASAPTLGNPGEDCVGPAHADRPRPGAESDRAANRP